MSSTEVSLFTEVNDVMCDTAGCTGHLFGRGARPAHIVTAEFYQSAEGYLYAGNSNLPQAKFTVNLPARRQSSVFVSKDDIPDGKSTRFAVLDFAPRTTELLQFSEWSKIVAMEVEDRWALNLDTSYELPLNVVF